MQNTECQIRNYKHKTLVFNTLQKYAKNRVFAANLCVVENKRVDFNIVCYEFWNKKGSSDIWSEK